MSKKLLGAPNTIFIGKHCSIWAEEQHTVQLFQDLESIQILYKRENKTARTLLMHLLDMQAQKLGIKDIFINSVIEESDSWLYENYNSWLMTTKYLLNFLSVAFLVQSIPTNQLNEVAAKYGFSLDEPTDKQILRFRRKGRL